MTKREKRINSWRNNPKNVRPEELYSILEYYGFERRDNGGSYVIFTHPKIDDTVVEYSELSLPRKNHHMRAVYVKKALEYLDIVMEE